MSVRNMVFVSHLAWVSYRSRPAHLPHEIHTHSALVLLVKTMSVEHLSLLKRGFVRSGSTQPGLFVAADPLVVLLGEGPRIAPIQVVQSPSRSLVREVSALERLRTDLGEMTLRLPASFAWDSPPVRGHPAAGMTTVPGLAPSYCACGLPAMLHLLH